MVMRVSDLLSALDDRAPFAAAANWDPVGLQIGGENREVGAAAVTHELTDETVRMCEEQAVLTVVTYHPLVFRPLATLTDAPGAEGRALRMAESGINVIAMHTNWDVASGGTADVLAGTLGLTEIRAFGADDEEPATAGIGRVGLFGGDPAALVATVGDALDVQVRSTAIHRCATVAVLPGSGGSFVPAALAVNADVLVTGDMSHHEARRALDGGMAVIDATHAATERPGVRALYAVVSGIVGSAIDLTGTDDNPWEGG